MYLVNSTKGEKYCKIRNGADKKIVKFVKFQFPQNFLNPQYLIPNTNLHYKGLLLINKTKDKKFVESATEPLKNRKFVNFAIYTT